MALTPDRDCRQPCPLAIVWFSSFYVPLSPAVKGSRGPFVTRPRKEPPGLEAAGGLDDLQLPFFQEPGLDRVQPRLGHRLTLQVQLLVADYADLGDVRGIVGE